MFKKVIFCIFIISIILNVILIYFLLNGKNNIEYINNTNIIYFTNYIYKNKLSYIEKEKVITNNIVIDNSLLDEIYVDYTNYIVQDVYSVYSNGYLILWHYKNTNIYKFNYKSINRYIYLKKDILNITNFIFGYYFKDNLYLYDISVGYKDGLYVSLEFYKYLWVLYVGVGVEYNNNLKCNANLLYEF